MAGGTFITTGSDRLAATLPARFHRFACGAISCGLQDNDGWASPARREATIAFARQADSRNCIPSGRTAGIGAAASSTIAAPHKTLPLRETSGTAGGATAPPSSCPSGLFVQSLHIGDI